MAGLKKVLIIGGGAAGMASAIFASEKCCDVHVFEHNEKLGKKLFITGKGRCNFTNACDPEDFPGNIVTNTKFMYSSFDRFNNRDAIDFFEGLGVKTKVERGARAFPASDHSSDIIRAMEREMKANGVKIHLGSHVKDLILEPYEEEQEKNVSGDISAGAVPGKGRSGNRKKKSHEKIIKGIRLENGHEIYGDAVILCTGGRSYASTGSTGTGYELARKAGMQVNDTRPALVPLLTKEEYIPEMQGLSLKNVSLTITYGKNGKKKYQGFGEMMFTHKGVTGPLVLSASSLLGKWLQEGPLKAEIDLKPALDEEQLEARIIREFEGAQNKQMKNVIAKLLPAKLRPVILRISGISGEKSVNLITKEERQSLIHFIRHFPFTITGTAGFDEAIITQGGIHVKDVDPKTMESKTTKNLYCIGEILDVDAFTGGFNLQIAWSTAYAAAQACV